MRFESLDIEMLKSRFAEMGTGYSLVYQPTVPSTNDQALKVAENPEAENLLFTTEYQSAGKGRRGRGWDVTDNCSLTFSLLLRPEIPLQNLSMITLVMGMAVAEGIKKASGIDAKIKWPNDIIYQGKKLCGILTETSPDLKAVVIGVGLNVGLCEWPKELAEKAISLEECGWKEASREQVLCQILDSFHHLFALFSKSWDMTYLLEKYDSLLVHKDKQILISAGKNSFEGISEGIDKNGCLLVKKESGQVTLVSAGEVSVHGVYGVL